ncbi:hypothetical protein Aperf_G00000132636 [Anoplocephala perfoliata]
MSIYATIRAVACISLPYLGIFLGLAVLPNMEFYQRLKKPFLAPPVWVFGPVWSMFFGYVSIASLYVLQEADNGANVVLAFLVYVAQLLLTWSWTTIYFGLKDITSSLDIIIAATIGAGISAYLFCSINSIAGYLMLLYTAWMCFMCYLNISTAMINRYMGCVGNADDKSKAD